MKILILMPIFILEFAISDFSFQSRTAHKKIDVCLYPGRRYPPDHPKQYQFTADFWYLLAFRFIMVLIFEVKYIFPAFLLMPIKSLIFVHYYVILYKDTIFEIISTEKVIIN